MTTYLITCETLPPPPLLLFSQYRQKYQLVPSILTLYFLSVCDSTLDDKLIQYNLFFKNKQNPLYYLYSPLIQNSEYIIKKIHQISRQLSSAIIWLYSSYFPVVSPAIEQNLAFSLWITLFIKKLSLLHLHMYRYRIVGYLADAGRITGLKNSKMMTFVTYFMVNSIPGIIADVTLSLAPVTYFMVNSIPGIIAGVTLPLSYDICLPPFYLYLYCGEFNTWYYCQRDSVAYRVVPVTNFMVSIPGIIAGVTLPLSYDIYLPLLFLLLMLR